MEHAVLWDHGQLVDLNDLVPAGSGLTLNEAFFINDRDEIAGIGTLPNQNQPNESQHAFLLIPCGSDDTACQGVTAGPGATLPNQTSSAVGTKNLTNADEDSADSGGVNSARQNLPRRLGLGRFSPVEGGIASTTTLTPAPIVALSPTSLTFATQAIGTTSGAKTVALKNTGSTNLTITAIAIVGTNAGDFSQTHSCGSSLAVGATCNISVIFKPTASGARTAALSISDNATGSPQKVSLSGIGTTAKLSPTSVNFGTVALGSSSFKTVTVTNVGTTTLTINGIAITGTNAADFTQSHTCGTSLAAAASCSIGITFRPAASGTGIAALSISDNAAGSPQTVSLRGIGTTAQLSPTSLDFGTVALGKDSSSKTVTMTNVGRTTLTISTIAITGTDPADFSEKNDCSTSVAASASCSVSVTFKPSASGTRTAALSISDNAAGSPQKTSLSGTGTTASLSPTSLNFGSVVLGSTSVAQAVTLTNVGVTTLTISSISISGINSSDFAESNNCSSSLAANASCSVDVKFKPATTGTLTAALSIVDNGAGSPQAVSLTGKGITGRCTPQGAQCSPLFPCCPGLVCVPASTRAFCEPSTSQNVGPQELYEQVDKIAERTPILKDTLPDTPW